MLYKWNKEVAFVSNNSGKTRQQYEANFGALGVQFDYDKQLIEPASSFVKYLKKINFEKTVFLIGTANVEKVFQENGIKYMVAVSWFSYEIATGS